MSENMDVAIKEAQLFWNQKAATESRRNRELRYQHGSGPCNVFILDASSSLGEEGFTQMKEAFTSIIAEYAKHPDIDENVAVIACGRETKFLCHFSNHYEKIQHCIDDLSFGGPSPLTAAFLLSTGCLINNASHAKKFGDLHVYPRIILISDGRPTDFISISGDDNTALESDQNKDHLLQFIRQLGKTNPIFCIPVGRHPDWTMLEFICNQSRGGKIVLSHEARQFAKYSQNIEIASRLSSTMLHDEDDRERVMMSLVCTFPDGEFSEIDQDDIYEVCLKKSLYGPIHEPVELEDLYRYEENDPRMPHLGTRVKRGRDWNWDNQDNFGLGTVIGHCKRVGWLIVEWDHGPRNIYRYGTTGLENDVYDVQVCNEPRILRNEHISAGCQVKRGPDWEWTDQDGGAGSVGSVVTVVDNGDVLVRWQNGFMRQYRFGRNGKFDLQVCDPFSLEAVRYREEQMRTPTALNYQPGAPAGPIEDFEKESVSSNLTGHETSPDTTIKPTLHVIKGKYFSNQSLSSDIETNSPGVSCGLGQWFWKDDTGKWNPFCRKTNDKINKCYNRDPKSTAIVTVKNQTYRVVMAKNLQINLATRETFEVKLVKNEFDS